LNRSRGGSSPRWRFERNLDIHIGPLVFEHADYDAEGDILYLHVGEPVEAEGEETSEGHVLRFERGRQRVVGLTVINARSLIDRDGRLIVTVPETVEATADELAPALALSRAFGPEIGPRLQRTPPSESVRNKAKRAQTGRKLPP